MVAEQWVFLVWSWEKNKVFELCQWHFIRQYLHLPLAFLRWTISDQLASYTDEGQLINVTVSLCDVMDNQMLRLVKTTFDWCQVMTTSV